MKLRAMLVVTLALSGCSFFSRSQSHFFSLDVLPPATTSSTARSVPLGIDALELPPPVDRREIVVRQANERVEIRGTDQWSAPFKPLVLHTLAFDLAARLPEGALVLPGAPRPSGAMRSLSVVIGELSAGPDAKVTLDARWTLRTPGAADAAHHERIEIPIASLDSANIASGTSQAIAALADRVAAGV